jgi:hypothetical protein
MAKPPGSDLARMFWLIPVSALLLLAAEPPWRTKAIAEWTEADAKQVLNDSPWSTSITAGVARRESEDERREGGNMGQSRGVGYDGVDPKGSGPKMPTSIGAVFTQQRSARSLPQSRRMTLRWESALPIRAAELKARVIEPPTLPGDGYSIAVYGVPRSDSKGEKLGDPLKRLAALKREGKRDVKPLRVEVFQLEDELIVVYLFPLSAEITKNDGHVEFDAQIGRIVIAHNFELSEMEFMGKLEL